MWEIMTAIALQFTTYNAFEASNSIIDRITACIMLARVFRATRTLHTTVNEI